MSINLPTEKEIDKVLHGIVNKEMANTQNLAMKKFQIDDIKQKSGRDLRNAI